MLENITYKLYNKGVIMTKEEMLKQLREYLEEYGKFNFHFHKSFITELVEFVKAVSFQQTFLNQLITILNNIREYTHNIYNVDSHEHLKGKNSSLYSLHMNCKNYNIRLLISFNQKDEPLFLVAFYERSGKRKTGYDSHTPIALTRRKEMLRR